jgi:hypothetical protein
VTGTVASNSGWPAPPGSGSYTFNSFQLDTQAAPIPEPATMLMLATGLAGAAVRHRRRRRTARAPE